MGQVQKYSRNEEECPGGGEMTSPRWVAGSLVCMGLSEDETSLCEVLSTRHRLYPPQWLQKAELNPLD